MKKIVLIVLSFVLVFCFAACSENNNESTATEEPKAQNLFTEDDFYFTFGDAKITIGGFETEFLETMKNYGFVENSRDEASSCMYGSTGGKDVTIYFDFGSVFTFPRTENTDNTVDEFYFMTNVFAVKGGITIGATKDDVLENFGENYTEMGETWIYNTSGIEKMNDVSPKISFYFENDVVTAIDLCANLYHI